MKASYEELEMEVIRFRTEDIITTSDAKNVTPVPEQQNGSPVPGQQNDPPVSEQQYEYYGTGDVVGIGTMDLFKPAGESGSLGDPAYIFYNGEYIKVYPANAEEDDNYWFVAAS